MPPRAQKIGNATRVLVRVSVTDCVPELCSPYDIEDQFFRFHTSRSRLRPPSRRCCSTPIPFRRMLRAHTLNTNNTNQFGARRPLDAGLAAPPRTGPADAGRCHAVVIAPNIFLVLPSPAAHHQAPIASHWADPPGRSSFLGDSGGLPAGGSSTPTWLKCREPRKTLHFFRFFCNISTGLWLRQSPT
jgi:hypothetical protein